MKAFSVNRKHLVFTVSAAPYMQGKMDCFHPTHEFCVKIILRLQAVISADLSIIAMYIDCVFILADCQIWCLSLMGESGPRRSTLVSRLPIFRRSVRKRQDSLPSSPSSGGVGNGVHTSSPSSTNSSSSSTGKRRSLFRTPSISFHSKRNSELRTDSNQLGADNRSRLSEPSFNDGCNNKTRHSFGFGGHKKKLSRSQTEDFEKTSTNRNVFINCISSGTNEGDDSGFLDDVSSKRSSKSKKLLPKSFSAHHRFSKNYSNQVEQNQGKDDAPKTGTPGSWPGELAESSLQSPMVSEDRTTAITPSEFVHVTEDTVSEVDALPVPSPAEVPPENISQGVSTSQTCAKPDQSNVEKPILPDMSQTANTKCESTTVQTEPETQNTEQEEHQDPIEASENELNPELSEESSSNAEPRERTHRNTVLVQQLGKSAGFGKLESRPSYLRKPHTGMMERKFRVVLCESKNFFFFSLLGYRGLCSAPVCNLHFQHF